MKEALSHFPLIQLPIAGQLIFMAIFFGVGIWVCRRGSKHYYDHLANLALEQEGNRNDKR